MEISEIRFLVAEDHEFQRRTLVRMLTSLGALEVLEAGDGRAALAVFQDPARPVHIIVCDLDMPEMDGMEFIRHVGEMGAQVSVILSSALDRHLVASVETMTTAYGMNLLGAIEKPATPQKLRDLIARHGADARAPVRRPRRPHSGRGRGGRLPRRPVRALLPAEGGARERQGGRRGGARALAAPRARRRPPGPLHSRPRGGRRARCPHLGHAREVGGSRRVLAGGGPDARGVGEPFAHLTERRHARRSHHRAPSGPRASRAGA